MKKSVIVPLMLGVIIMLITAAPVTSTNIAVAGEYKKTEAASLANNCGNGIFLFNVLCQNLESQIRGDGNAVNIIGVQTGGEFEFSDWLNGIDEQQLLSAFEWLKTNGFDKELLSGSDTVNAAGYGGGFILILVLFILLVIIGAGFGGG
jgi:uncharacterized protein (TIGR01732 family)